MPRSFWRSRSARWWGRASSVSAWPQETLNPPSSSTCPTWTSPSTKQMAGTTSTRTQTDTPPRVWSSCGRKASASTTAALPSTSTAASTTCTDERAYTWSYSRRVSRDQLYAKTDVWMNDEIISEFPPSASASSPSSFWWHSHVLCSLSLFKPG